MAQKVRPFPKRKTSYKQALARTDIFCDGLGKPVDSGIKPLVATLVMYGVKTKMSCHGHESWGLPYPWVDIDYASAYVAGRIICVGDSPRRRSISNNARTRNKVSKWVLVPYGSWMRLMPRNTKVSLPTMRKWSKELAQAISGF